MMSAASCITRARSMKWVALHFGKPAFAAATARLASALVPFWNSPITSLRFAGDVSAKVPSRDQTSLPSMNIGCRWPNSARTFTTAASYASWNSSWRPASTAFCQVRSFWNAMPVSLDVRVHGPRVVLVERRRAQLPEDLPRELTRIRVRRDFRRRFDPAQDRLQALLPLRLRHPLVHRRNRGLYLDHRSDETLAQRDNLLLLLVHGGRLTPHSTAGRDKGFSKRGISHRPRARRARAFLVRLKSRARLGPRCGRVRPGRPDG